MKAILWTAVTLIMVVAARADERGDKTVQVHYSAAKGIGPEKGVMRRDPSDIIKVNDLYYKGRQLGKSPGKTKLGVAISDKPGGPYVKYAGNPAIPGNHEVLVWPQGRGVAAMIGSTGPKEITRSVVVAADGLHFSKTHSVIDVPTAAGAYRPEAFTDSGTGKRIQWGMHIGRQKGSLPFIQRFHLVEVE